MTLTTLVSAVYCSLETPAISAAPYAHQWHKKQMIFGLNFNIVGVVICLHLLRQHYRLFVSIVVYLYGTIASICAINPLSVKCFS